MSQKEEQTPCKTCYTVRTAAQRLSAESQTEQKAAAGRRAAEETLQNTQEMFQRTERKTRDSEQIKCGKRLHHCCALKPTRCND
eukprot:2420973-Amphidinium_carterae.3